MTMPADRCRRLLFPRIVHSSVATVFKVERVFPNALAEPELAHGSGSARTPLRAAAVKSAAATAVSGVTALPATNAITGAPFESKARAFTLLEVLLSIAIVALVVTVLIGGSARLLSEQPVTPYEVFWKAVVEARKTALKAEHDIRLKFDKEKKQFVLIDGIAPTTLAADGVTPEEKTLKQFPILAAAGTEVTVDFLPPATKGGGNAILVGGVLMESQSMKFVTFYSDGTCSPFRAQFVRNGATSTPLAIDPWTCAPVLPPTDPNAVPTP